MFVVEILEPLKHVFLIQFVKIYTHTEILRSIKLLSRMNMKLELARKSTVRRIALIIQLFMHANAPRNLDKNQV